VIGYSPTTTGGGQRERGTAIRPRRGKLHTAMKRQRLRTQLLRHIKRVDVHGRSRHADIDHMAEQTRRRPFGAPGELARTHDEVAT
jgi:hypothetical protein